MALFVDALGAKGSFRASRRTAIADVSGHETAELSLVPTLFVDRTLAALRKAEPLRADDCVEAFHTAARLFATGTVEGQSVDEYAYTVSRVAGIPISVVRAATRSIAQRLVLAYDSAHRARPVGAVGDWRDPLTRSGHAVWTRRGQVFAVHAAGNHPGTHSMWPQALALGYRVAVRPSSREPFTPHRLISALRTAGFGDDRVALLPTAHQHAESLLRGADLGMVYGGQEVIDRFGRDPRMLPQGPGRSKVLITADVDWRDHLEVIVDSVSMHGGTGCVNTTTVLVEGDPTPLCEALAERLAALPSLPPEDEKAVLPVQPSAAAHKIAGFLAQKAQGTRPWLGAAHVVAELGDGSAVMRPAVHQVDGPQAPQARIELPFPCVWVAPWTSASGVGSLRDTLTLTVLTGRAALVDALLDEPTIGNVHIGDQPTCRIEPGLPHDGFLGDFLMRSKTVIREGTHR